MGTNGVKNEQEAAGGQHQRIAIGQKYAAHLVAIALSGLADAVDDLVIFPRPKFLLRCGIHFTEGALIPRAAVGDWQDQRFGLAGRTKNRLDVTDGDHRLAL